MSFITRKSLSRRTMLRGMGATMALPFGRHGAGSKGCCCPHRFLTFYVPNGMAMGTGLPRAKVGFELSPILQPLAEYKNQMLVLSGMHASWNYIHAEPPGHFLRERPWWKTEIEIIADVSIDQRSRNLQQRNPGGFTRDGDGCSSQCRRMHGKPELHLHPYAILAQSDAASADGIQPACRVRKVVWGQWKHGTCRA